MAAAVGWVSAVPKPQMSFVQGAGGWDLGDLGNCRLTNMRNHLLGWKHRLKQKMRTTQKMALHCRKAVTWISRKPTHIPKYYCLELATTINCKRHAMQHHGQFMAALQS